MTYIREVCHHPGCEELQTTQSSNYRGTGRPFYRKWCSKHYVELQAKNAGLTVTEYNARRIKIAAKNAGLTPAEYRARLTENAAKKAGLTLAEYGARCKQNTAKNAGYSSVTDYKNSKHPYRKHKKDHCENRDGRLGFVCNYEIRHKSQLQVDHKSGNPTVNKKQNLQTLCINCHTYKTYVLNKDHLSPGRKTLKHAKPLISKKTKTSKKSITYKKVAKSLILLDL